MGKRRLMVKLLGNHQGEMDLRAGSPTAERRTRSRSLRGTISISPVDMMRDHIDQNLRCGADCLPRLLSLIDQRLSFSVQVLRLFNNRLCPPLKR
jgi:hypothetical protein